MPDPPNPHYGADLLWERWDEVDRLFEAALDVPAAERERFVVQACGGDLALLRMLRELLTMTDRSAAVGDSPGAALMRAAWSGAGEATPLAAGQRVGPYRIVEELGRGGMATVYVAERADGSFERRVALKVLRRGVDTDDVVRRFLAERQILSGLTHPNIARLLDGGSSSDGRPFLVLDLVAGEPITDYADRAGLPVRDRLRLFQQVASAVQYAHQRLVVHRDLKPSNILVTAEGQAKLLDFGIAKLLGTEQDGTTTHLGVHPLTPQYASPEQLRGDPITTASDVYQLGVLLHLLLTGERPCRAGDDPAAPALRPSQLLRAATATEATAPAAARTRTMAAARAATPEALRRALRGDLDTIVQRALEPEPENRYESADALATDVRRHLDGLPIAARPPSVSYRLRKLVGRKPWIVPVAAVLLLGAFGFGATRYRHAIQLERERNEAQAQAARAEQLKDFMIGLFGSADPYAPADPERGRAITVVEALALGAKRARTELADRPAMRADLLSAIASVYQSLDQREPALRLIDEVLAIRREQQATRSPEYATELGRQAVLLGLAGLADSADAIHRRRLQLERELYGPDHPRVADALIAYSSHLFNAGDFEAVMRLRAEAVRILRSAQPPQPERLGEALGFLAGAYRELHQTDAADSLAREALALRQQTFGDDHPSTAIARVYLAQVAHERGDFATATALYREAIPVLERTLGTEHRNTQASWNNLGIVLMEAQDFAAAEQVHRRILELRRRLAGTDDDPEIAGSLQNLAAALLRQARYVEAESLSLAAYDIYRRVTPEGHYLRAFPLLGIAEGRLLQNDGAGAERAAGTALPILRAALPAGHYATAVAQCRVAAGRALQGRVSDARRGATSALATLRANEQTPERLLRECAATHASLGLTDPG